MVTSSPLPLLDHFVGKKERDPLYYGRYRLWFQQIAPWFSDHAALVPVRAGETANLEAELDAIKTQHSEHMPLRRIDRSQAAAWDLRAEAHDTPFDALLSLEQLADVCYIDMRNFGRALDQLAPYLEDARILVCSTGDGDDRWMDEHTIAGGCAESRRWIANFATHLHEDRLRMHEALLDARRDDERFRRFVASCTVSALVPTARPRRCAPPT